jgi:heme A synthase
MSYTPETPGQPDGNGERRTNPRGALIFAAVVVVLAIILVGLFLTAGGDEACDDWTAAKTEWVSSFPPIQQSSKSDLADFQGWVEIDGERVDRPEGCT